MALFPLKRHLPYGDNITANRMGGSGNNPEEISSGLKQMSEPCLMLLSRPLPLPMVRGTTPISWGTAGDAARLRVLWIVAPMN